MPQLASLFLLVKLLSCACMPLKQPTPNTFARFPSYVCNAANFFGGKGSLLSGLNLDKGTTGSAVTPINIDLSAGKVCMQHGLTRLDKAGGEADARVMPGRGRGRTGWLVAAPQAAARMRRCGEADRQPGALLWAPCMWPRQTQCATWLHPCPRLPNAGLEHAYSSSTACVAAVHSSTLTGMHTL